MPPPNHKASELNTVFSIRKVMHREVRALPLWIELLDLVIAGDSWSPDLNVVTKGLPRGQTPLLKQILVQS